MPTNPNELPPLSQIVELDFTAQINQILEIQSGFREMELSVSSITANFREWDLSLSSVASKVGEISGGLGGIQAPGGGSPLSLLPGRNEITVKFEGGQDGFGGYDFLGQTIFGRHGLLGSGTFGFGLGIGQGIARPAGIVGAAAIGTGLLRGQFLKEDFASDVSGDLSLSGVDTAISPALDRITGKLQDFEDRIDGELQKLNPIDFGIRGVQRLGDLAIGYVPGLRTDEEYFEQEGFGDRIARVPEGLRGEVLQDRISSIPTQRERLLADLEFTDSDRETVSAFLRRANESDDGRTTAEVIFQGRQFEDRANFLQDLPEESRVFDAGIRSGVSRSEQIDLVRSAAQGLQETGQEVRGEFDFLEQIAVDARLAERSIDGLSEASQIFADVGAAAFRDLVTFSGDFEGSIKRLLQLIPQLVLEVAVLGPLRNILQNVFSAGFGRVAEGISGGEGTGAFGGAFDGEGAFGSGGVSIEQNFGVAGLGQEEVVAIAAEAGYATEARIIEGRNRLNSPHSGSR